jgi:hypothetical protein
MLLRRTFLVQLAAVAAACLPGCARSKKNRPLAPVRGRIIYRGKPLQFGTVMFQSKSGQPSFGEIQADGTFHLTTRGEGDGAVVGLNQVSVTCTERQEPAKKPADGHGERPMGKSLIPAKYASIDASGITVEVRAGENPPVELKLAD